MWYDKLNSINLAYSNIVDDRNHHLEGSTLFINPTADELEAVWEYLNLNPSDEIEASELEQIIMQKIEEDLK